jgi:hypothetical protein
MSRFPSARLNGKQVRALRDAIPVLPSATVGERGRIKMPLWLTHGKAIRFISQARIPAH